MTKYQSVKVTFDLDDDFQLKLYEYLKDRTNGSSYIRTLIHQDIAANQPPIQPMTVINYQPDLVVKEPVIQNSEQSETVVEVKPDMQSASVRQTTHHDIKLMINNQQIGFIEDDISIDDLI